MTDYYDDNLKLQSGRHGAVYVAVENYDALRDRFEKACGEVTRLNGEVADQTAYAGLLLEAALKAVDDEEELDGPMPDEVRAAFQQDPETSCRMMVQLTKRNIRARIEALRDPKFRQMSFDPNCPKCDREPGDYCKEPGCVMVNAMFKTEGE